MIKKIGSFLLVAVMLMAMLTPFTAMANQGGQCGDNVFWVLNDAGTLAIAGTGDMWNWEDYSDVPWYHNRLSVKNVVINYGATSIGNNAFIWCESLTTISIPGSVTSIGEDAFSYCFDLTTISIPGSVTSIGGGAFHCCNSLTTISIPSSVTSIGDGALGNCDSLVAIFVDENNPNYRDINGVLYSKDRKTLFCYPAGKRETYYTIPDGVTSIGNYAFWGCPNLAVISIAGSVTSIGDWAFHGCTNLASISIPGSVTCIGNRAFYCCDRLTSISIPYGVTSIGDWAFAFCDNLTSISIPDSVTSIGNHAFSDCESLTSISIPASITSIGDFTFYDCYDLTSISIPGSVTSIGESTFAYCDSLSSISIPGSVTNMGYWAFNGCASLYDIYYAGSEAEWRTLAKDAKVPETTKVHYGNNYSVAPGTVIGSALRTNITAAINGHAIPSFNVDGYTYIVAEDLKDYGFSVYYDNATRTLALSRDTAKTDITRSYVKPYVAPGEVGIKEHDLVATDIVTYLDNNCVQSYNINGQTIIKFDELGRYGAVSFDNSTRIISVTIPGLN